MLKFCSRIPDQGFYKIDKSPKQYSNSQIKITEMGEEIQHLSGYDNAVKVFHHFLTSSNCKYFDKFLIRGQHNNLEVHNPMLIHQNAI